MVCQLWPLVVSLGLNNPLSNGFTLAKSRIKRYDTTNRGDCVYVKWKILDFTLLWQTALSGVPRIVTKNLILPKIATKKIIVWQIAKKKIIVPWIVTVRSLNLKADCQGFNPVVANRGTPESGVPRGYSCQGKPRY
jgi:hypothetical protein